MLLYLKNINREFSDVSEARNFLFYPKIICEFEKQTTGNCPVSFSHKVLYVFMGFSYVFLPRNRCFSMKHEKKQNMPMCFVLRHFFTHTNIWKFVCNYEKHKCSYIFLPQNLILFMFLIFTHKSYMRFRGYIWKTHNRELFYVSHEFFLFYA